MKKSTPSKTKKPKKPVTGRTPLVADPIKHIVVLMMENRSFDHFLGSIPYVNGVNPRRFNYERPGSTKSYYQKSGAISEMDPDPGHDHHNVMRQIAPGSNLGSMGGFVYDFVEKEKKAKTKWPEIMRYFDLGKLPILHSLATSFCVSDSWFSSVPGPTWTNRFFAHSGTSQGWVEMPKLWDWNLHKYDQTTVYDRLNEKKITWQVYAASFPLSLLLYNQRMIPENCRRHKGLKQFFKDLKSPKTFPTYAFIEPDYLWPNQNDHHPPNHVLEGDNFIGYIYNAIRKSPVWESVLFIVTWDEHGGFYDHVSPPSAIPPDNYSQEGFKFDRYGVRVPLLLISKWVKAGSVFRPKNKKSILDHTSILRYLTDKFNLGLLGNRVKNAASFAEAIVPSENLVAPKQVGLSPLPIRLRVEEIPKLNDNQRGIIEFSRRLEFEMRARPDEVGIRAMRAASSLGEEMEVAKERAWLFIERNSAG